MMQPIAGLTQSQLARVRWILTDIDDTLTEHGKLTAAAYQAIWQLHAAGIGVIAVTGRPAGWCDAIARQWPVAAVVGENGALVFSEKKGRLERLYHPNAADPATAQQQLEDLWQAVLREVPRARIAKDQFSRMFDLAIDFAEEQPHLSREEVLRIHAVCEREGAVAKISSIHVNAWFGDYSKLGMSERFLREEFGVDIYVEADGVAYVGDSPNDSPMFAAVPLSVGVANVRDFSEELDPAPRWVTEAGGGAGFAEFAAEVLAAQAEIHS
ncbi:HAD family hydrolase [Spirochaeta africana]|uniref:HAD-superfamily hydrolase, subfamily IIB n=1 Tax=Spirochaeta africana (strain ATCC 700263 / DSM 8902 / Z-7692) TaxID=889378 RepID=H9UM80_SPIAZ|nr:HAD-IIB family hydrolase [Spirochaeta africana]AFG38623.1 HAD-superfamily hydrolase, subfamily IIB [Spirochaeta africana DSM 8902]